MTNCELKRYSETSHVGEWAGWYEPEDRSWIMFVAKDQSAVFYPHRDPETGAVI